MGIQLERRRSDFEADASVVPFTGSCCCCCCCLHWIGAAVGGVVGMKKAWNDEASLVVDPSRAAASSALTRGLVVGTLALVLVCLTATAGFVLGTGTLIALALAPPLAFVVTGLSMMISTYALRTSRLRAFRREAMKLPPKEGDGTNSFYRMKLLPAPKAMGNLVGYSVFCRHCWHDLGEVMHLAACPECDAAIDHPVLSGPDFGVALARRVALSSIGYSTAGAAAGYVLMVLIAILLK